MADPNKLRKVPTFNPQAATARAMAPAEPQMVTVKAKVDTVTNLDGSTYESPRVVYDLMDTMIPHDVFVDTPLTASITLAILSGDLEQADTGTGDEGAPEGRAPAPDFSKMHLPAEFGGRLTEEVQRARQERRERAQSRMQERREAMDAGR
jgi:hypothetical protein